MDDARLPRRVLVIDDEESLRHALSKGLARAGWTVVAEATGKGGVDAFRAQEFDVVLTDLKIPDLGGLDVVAILTETDADVPVVVMTGYGSMDTALEAMRRGARDYVQKPFSVEEVARVLEKAVADTEGGAADDEEERRLRTRVERRFAPEGYERVEAELRAQASAEAAPAATASGGGPAPLKEAQRAFEVRYVEDLLARTGGNVAAAARIAGISRPNFHKKLRTLGVDPARFKRAARRGRTE
jgi:DNA-binding NtrC family response regulator